MLNWESLWSVYKFASVIGSGNFGNGGCKFSELAETAGVGTVRSPGQENGMNNEFSTLYSAKQKLLMHNE